jgi:hypothetical protein
LGTEHPLSKTGNSCGQGGWLSQESAVASAAECQDSIYDILHF